MPFIQDILTNLVEESSIGESLATYIESRTHTLANFLNRFAQAVGLEDSDLDSFITNLPSDEKLDYIPVKVEDFITGETKSGLLNLSAFISGLKTTTIIDGDEEHDYELTSIRDNLGNIFKTKTELLTSYLTNTMQVAQTIAEACKTLLTNAYTNASENVTAFINAMQARFGSIPGSCTAIAQNIVSYIRDNALSITDKANAIFNMICSGLQSNPDNSLPGGDLEGITGANMWTAFAHAASTVMDAVCTVACGVFKMLSAALMVTISPLINAASRMFKLWTGYQDAYQSIELPMGSICFSDYFQTTIVDNDIPDSLKSKIDEHGGYLQCSMIGAYLEFYKATYNNQQHYFLSALWKPINWKLLAKKFGHATLNDFRTGWRDPIQWMIDHQWTYNETLSFLTQVTYDDTASVSDSDMYRSIAAAKLLTIVEIVMIDAINREPEIGDWLTFSLSFGGGEEFAAWIADYYTIIGDQEIYDRIASIDDNSLIASVAITNLDMAKILQGGVARVSPYLTPFTRVSEYITSDDYYYAYTYKRRLPFGVYHVLSDAALAVIGTTTIVAAIGALVAITGLIISIPLKRKAYFQQNYADTAAFDMADDIIRGKYKTKAEIKKAFKSVRKQNFKAKILNLLSGLSMSSSDAATNILSNISEQVSLMSTNNQLDNTETVANNNANIKGTDSSITLTTIKTIITGS